MIYRLLPILLLLFFLNQTYGQSLNNYATISAISSGSINYNSNTYYQKTIGYYPQMTISCHEAIADNEYSGFLTILKDAISVHTYILSPRILIRDMVQFDFSDTVYFCGVRLPYGTNDSIGVMGFIIINNQNGALNNIKCINIPEVETLTNITVIRANGNNTIATIGRKKNNNTIDYFFVKGFLDPLYYSGEYDICQLGTNPIPTDIISTDDYVAIISTDFSNTISIRKFAKYNLDNTIRNYAHTFSLPEHLSSYKPYSTFLNNNTIEDNENEIATVFMGQDNAFSWKLYLKKIDLTTMSMTNAQNHSNIEKNLLLGVSYISKYKQITVLELVEPNYLHFDPTVVLLDPNKNQTYTSNEISGNSMNNVQTITRLYETMSDVSYFLCGCITGNYKQYLTHNIGSLMSDNCINNKEIKIYVDEIVSPVTTLSPLQTIHHISTIYGVNGYEYNDPISTNCLSDFQE